MTSQLQVKISRNDPCPCGSGRKYKRCCLRQRVVSEDSLWARQREASDELTRQMMKYAELKFAEQVVDAWEDFHLGVVTMRFERLADEQMIFMPYFLFHWDPEAVGRRRKGSAEGGVVARSFIREHGRRLSELQRQILDQALTQPVSFHQVISSKHGESIDLVDILTGSQTKAIERTASQQAQPGDLLYGSVWVLPGIAVLGCCAPIRIPPERKAEIIGLRKKLRRRVAKQGRSLFAEDLVRYADEIRATYLDMRDSLNAPPRLQNTDGDPLVFHTLTFRIESVEEAFEALAPLAVGRSREDLLCDAQADKGGKLRKVAFDWLKKGNRKFSTWENTILGSIKISEHTVIAEVNSEKRAARLRWEIEKRLGPAAVHQSTLAQTPEEMLKKSPPRKHARPKMDDPELQELLSDPEVRKRAQESVQKQVEAWVHQRIPALGNRTPMQAVQDADGREIVEALLLAFERHAEGGAFPGSIRPDINAVRRLLRLPAQSS